MDNETKLKSIELIKKGLVYKVSASDAIEIISSDDELKSMKDQTGKVTCESEYLKRIKHNVVIKRLRLHDSNDHILYWCPCDLNDMMYMIGGQGFDSSKGKYAKINHVGRKNQISFRGKDIKRSFTDNKDKLNDIEKNFVKTYIDIEHTIGDNIFYTMYFKEENGDQSIHCSRNTFLSPRKSQSNQVLDAKDEH